MRLKIIPGRLLIILLVLIQCSHSFVSKKIRSPQEESLQSGRKSCRNPTVRKEWRKLRREEKLDYLGAVKCLWTKPAIGKAVYPTLKTRHDDFAALHANATDYGIHFSGIFPPWHRYLLHLYEKALRNECHYRGPIPYWDWTLDASAWNASPLFDPRTGFGGNGFNSTPPPPNPTGPPPGLLEVIGGCITDGPFADLKLVVGPGSNFTGAERCLVRNFNPVAIQASCPYDIAIKPLYAAENYSQAEPIIEGPAHNCGHQGVGGEMFNIWSSNNDPIFYLHHGSIDWMWSLWQGRNKTRLRDMGAPLPGSFFPPAPGGSNSTPSLPPGFPPISTVPTTLDTIIEVGYHGADVPVRAVMDTLNSDNEGILCYRYE